jgi:aspartate/glutamate racemase
MSRDSTDDTTIHSGGGGSAPPPSVPDATEASEALLALQKKHKGTIGIIGTTPTNVAKLNEEIVKYCNSIGLSRDQQIPEIIAIGIPTTDGDFLRDQAKICSDFGCDILAITESEGGDKSFRSSIADLSMQIQFGNDLTELAKTVTNLALSVKKPRRDNLVFSSNKNSEIPEEEGKRLESNFKRDVLERNARVAHRKEHGRYPILDHKKFVGILGGGGPMASAQFATTLAGNGDCFVHWSQSSTPGKIEYEMGVGPDYIERYRAAAEYFKSISASVLAMPCNTAHKHLEEINPSLLPTADIRKAMLDDPRVVGQCILLGTASTTGVGLPRREDRTKDEGTYPKFLRENYGYSRREFILPNEAQQQMIAEAINDVKAGRYDEAKVKISTVVEELRASDPLIPVILACTELPIPWTKTDLMSKKFFDPSDAMAKVAKEMINEASRKRGRSDSDAGTGGGAGGGETPNPSARPRNNVAGRGKFARYDDGAGAARDSSSEDGTPHKPTSEEKFSFVSIETTKTGQIYRIYYHNPDESEEDQKEYLKDKLERFGNIANGDRINFGKKYASFHNLSEAKLEELQTWVKENGIETRAPVSTLVSSQSTSHRR